MINVQANISLPRPAPLDTAAIAGAIGNGARQLPARYPQSDMWEITVHHARAKYDVRNAAGEIKSYVQAVGRGADRLSVGQVVEVSYYDRDRKRPYIVAGVGWADWSTTILRTLGDWMQCYANPYLSLCGRTAIASIETASTELLDLDGDSHQDYGIRKILGVVAHSSNYLIIHYVGNSGDTGYDKIRIEAVDLASNTLAWTYDISVASTTSRAGAFTSNAFLDPDRNLLHILAQGVITVVLPAAGTVPSVTYSDTTITPSMLTACAWTSMIHCTGDLIVRRWIEATHTWGIASTTTLASQFASSYSIASTSTSQITGSLAPNRAWPFDLDALCFRAILAGRKVVNLEADTDYADALSTVSEQRIVNLPTTGPATSSSAVVVVWAAIVLDSIMAPWETYWSATLYPITTGPSGLTYTQDDYAGRATDGTSYHVATGPGTSGWVRYFEVQAPGAYCYLCPRSTSQAPSAYQWSEANNDYVPGAICDGAGHTIYAVIEPVGPLIYTGTVEYTPVDLGDATVPASVDADTPSPGFHTDHFNFAHIPEHTHAHRTMLRWVTSAGIVTHEIELSQRFAGFQFGSQPDASPNIATESVPMPENVWQIALGRTTLIDGLDATHQNAVFALYDHRATLDAEHRLRLTIIDGLLATRGSIDLGDTTLIVGGANDGRFAWQQFSPPQIRINYPDTGAPWAVVGMWSTLLDAVPGDAFFRAELYCWEITDLDAPLEMCHLVEDTGAGTIPGPCPTRLPGPTDFDRMFLAGDMLRFVGNPDSTTAKVWKIY